MNTWAVKRPVKTLNHSAPRKAMVDMIFTRRRLPLTRTSGAALRCPAATRWCGVAARPALIGPGHHGVLAAGARRWRDTHPPATPAPSRVSAGRPAAPGVAGKTRSGAARSTVACEIRCPSYRHIARALRCPRAGCARACRRTASRASSRTGRGHGPFHRSAGSPRGPRRARPALRGALPHPRGQVRFTQSLGQIRDLGFQLLLTRRGPRLTGHQARTAGFRGTDVSRCPPTARAPSPAAPARRR